MKWLLSLLFCLSTLAQLPIIPYVISSGAPAKSPTNLVEQLPEFWWRASDLNSVTPLNYNWVDRTQGKVFKFDASGGGSAPTVNALSVTIVGSVNACLSNNVPPVGTGYLFPNSSGKFRTVAIVIKPTAGHFVTQGILADAASQGLTYFQSSHGTFAWGINFSRDAGTNPVVQDWVITQTNLAASALLVILTNNVQASVSGTSAQKSALFLGGNGGVAQMFADIYEIICFTNKVGFGGFTNLTDLADLHNYFTNATTGYSFSP